MSSLNEREEEVLLSMECVPEWLRPMDVGGFDASHHSRTLVRLWRRGFVERRSRSGRKAYEYQITDAGTAAIKAWRNKEGRG